MPDPIKHVVLLILENHSFDQMLGCFQRVYPDLEGVDPDNAHSNTDIDGKVYAQHEAAERQVKPDPKHELDNVLLQLQENNGRFALDYSAQYPRSTVAQRQLIMDYYPLDSLPALHQLARDFTICDHWYSSLPGPTWPNRFFALSGTSKGRATMPEGAFNLHLHLYDQDTIFDRLNEKKIPWKVYFHDMPQSWLLVHQLEHPFHYHHMERFYQDAAGPEAEFPSFCFIEPKYFSEGQNDDHPPHDVLLAQVLLADVYNALRKNIDLWNSTLFVLFYDEHGGFYDHVSPPVAVPPDQHRDEYSFDRFGVRVPALLISPWVGREPLQTEFDHTSLLRYLTDKWTLGPLGERTAKANSVGAAIHSTGEARTDTVDSLSIPVALQATVMAATVDESPRSLNEHQRALIAFTEHLETKIDDSPRNKADRHQRKLLSHKHQFEVAQERVDLFLQQERRRQHPTGLAGLFRNFWSRP